MHYCGSKARTAGPLLYYMMKNIEGRKYVEPFLGGANVMCRVDKKLDRYGNDYNPYLIALWKALQNGWMPPEFVTREEYNSVKNNMDSVEPHIVGYIGTVCSFNGYWFGGYQGLVRHQYWKYRKNPRDKSPIWGNHQDASRRNVLAQIEGMMGVTLTSGDYTNVRIDDNSLVFCDPPYLTSSNKYLKADFSHEQFWEWCRQLTKRNVLVFVTEYTHPDDFVPIWIETPSVTTYKGGVHGQNQLNRLLVYEQQIERIDTTAPPPPPKLKVP